MRCPRRREQSLLVFSGGAVRFRFILTTLPNRLTMSIYRITFLVAGLLVATGLAAYVASGTGSVTALIPTILGVFLGGLAALAQARRTTSKQKWATRRLSQG